MTITKALRALDRIIADKPQDWYRIERYKHTDGSLWFSVYLCVWSAYDPPVHVTHEGKDPLLTRAIWDVLNIASLRTI